MVEEIDLFPMEKLAAELSRPMLILHGMLDTVVPYQVSLTFMEQAVCPHIELRLFKDGDHSGVAADPTTWPDWSPSVPRSTTE